MKPSSSKASQPLFFSVTLFFILLLVIIIAGAVIDFTRFDVFGLLFMTAFVCCALIAKSVYDSLVVNEQIARTEVKIADSIAIDSEELHTQLYQNSPVPYMLLDTNGVVKSANIAAGRLYCETVNSLVGESVFESLFSEEADHIVVLQQKFKSGVPLSEETVQVHCKNGKTAWVLLSLFPYENAYGEKIGLLTLVDITKQKQIENAKAEFVSLASHQLRTPIAGIKWSAELLQMDPDKNLNEKQRRYVERLLTGVKRMALLVDDFLRVSRFELGTFQPEYKMVSLPTLFSEIIREQEDRVIKKNISIETFFDPNISEFNTDPNLLRMAISNLYSNSVKYTKPGGTVHVGYKKINNELHVSVADNGMGIPVADQERIFTKLYRASNATRNEPDGTGLGLYIVKEAIDVLRGKISFTSVENVSTTFDIILPINQ